MRRKIKTQAGFALVELLVALTIVIAMSVMILALSYPWLLSFKLNSAARGLAVDLRFVQQKAVAEQIKYGIYFGADFYQLKRFGSTSTTVLLSKPLPGDVRFSQVSGFNGNEAVFNVYGAVEEAGSIILTNSRDESKTLNVRPSGFVKVY